MTLDQANTIIAAAESVGIFELDCHRNYSGRGMFGEQTTGVTGRLGDINRAIALAAADHGREFVMELGEVRFDQFGLGHVAY